MRAFASRILLLALEVSACTIFAFTVSTSSPAIVSTVHTNVAKSSPLFRKCSDISITNRLHQVSTEMSAGEEGSAPDNEASTEVPSTEITTSSNDDKETPENINKKERSGFLTALIVGPPLIIKFAIVLLVKFLTDVVVFPILILYRFVKLCKIKVAAFFASSGNKDPLKSDEVNGSSPS